MAAVPGRPMSRAGCFSSSSRPWGYRPYRCEYGDYRSMAYPSIRSRYITEKMPNVLEIDSRHFKHPTRNHSVQILCGIANISISSAGDVGGCYDLGTGPEDICLVSAVLASTFAGHLLAISSHFATILPQVFALSVERPQFHGSVDLCKASMAHSGLSLLTRTNPRQVDETWKLSTGPTMSVILLIKLLLTTRNYVLSAQKPCRVCLGFARNRPRFWTIFICRSGLERVIQAINIMTLDR